MIDIKTHLKSKLYAVIFLLCVMLVNLSDRKHGGTQRARSRQYNVPHPDRVRGLHAPAVEHVPSASRVRMPK